MKLSRSVARFNKVVINRIQGVYAWLVPPWGVILHRGRRSGPPYRTPVPAFRHGQALVVALLYGEESDWLRNLRAAGGGRVVGMGRTSSWASRASSIRARPPSSSESRQSRGRTVGPRSRQSPPPPGCQCGREGCSHSPALISQHAPQSWLSNRTPGSPPGRPVLSQHPRQAELRKGRPGQERAELRGNEGPPAPPAPERRLERMSRGAGAWGAKWRRSGSGGSGKPPHARPQRDNEPVAAP